jgi:hypothetical protein
LELGICLIEIQKSIPTFGNVGISTKSSNASDIRRATPPP